MAELDLGRLTGLAPGTPITTATPAATALPGVADLVAVGEAELVRRALEHRPERIALDARRDALRFAASLARAGTRPYLVGVAAVEPARPNPRFVPPTDRWRTAWNLGVTFTWPLFDSGRSRAEATALDQQAAAVEARRQDVDGIMGLEVRQRVRDVVTAQAAIAAATEGVAAAAEARRVVEERFRAGAATSTDVLDAQVAALEADVEYTRLQASLRLTEARLLRAMGHK
jgi:outer membrane protein